MSTIYENVQLRIEQKRNIMIKLGMDKGFSSQHTIKASQDLDRLIALIMVCSSVTTLF